MTQEEQDAKDRDLIAEARRLSYGIALANALARVMRERDEARRLHSKAEGEIECRGEMRDRIRQLEAQAAAMREALESCPVVVLPHGGAVHAEHVPAWAKRRAAALAGDAGRELLARRAKAEGALASSTTANKELLARLERAEAEAEARKLTARLFPIQGGPAVPWSVMEPHDAQCRKNHGGQSLERIAERGGLSAGEAYAVVHGLGYHDTKAEHSERTALWREFVRTSYLVESKERLELSHQREDDLKARVAELERERDSIRNDAAREIARLSDRVAELEMEVFTVEDGICECKTDLIDARDALRKERARCARMREKAAAAMDDQDHWDQCPLYGIEREENAEDWEDCNCTRGTFRDIAALADEPAGEAPPPAVSTGVIDGIAAYAAESMKAGEEEELSWIDAGWIPPDVAAKVREKLNKHTIGGQVGEVYHFFSGDIDDAIDLLLGKGAA